VYVIGPSENAASLSYPPMFLDNDNNGLLVLYIVSGEIPLQLRPSPNAMFENNGDAIGTRLWLETPDGVTQMRDISTGSTHGGGDQRAAFFGLGTNATGDLTVRWPTCIIEVI
jgi:hypothetical protein